MKLHNVSRTKRIVRVLSLLQVSCTNADFEVMYDGSLKNQQRLPGLAFFFTSRILFRARWSNFDRSPSEGIIYLNVGI